MEAKKADNKERLDRVEKALRTLCDMLVYDDSEFGQHDADEINKILRGENEVDDG